jgi:Bifunctional DNA primase/polymerase, N-terminal.
MSALMQLAAAEEDPAIPAHAVNWNTDGTWQHRPILRATDTSPRRPIINKPENLKPGSEPGDVTLSERYWTQQVSSTWYELQSVIENGFKVNKRMVPCDVALFPASSGLVVIDCDVKSYDTDSGFVVIGNSATLAPPVIKHGIEDLRREVEALGHSLVELATYTVQTKSGGYHLYFRENPRTRLQNTGHRHDWRVDVISHNSGSDRSWVAAPPTPGYEVVRDLPLAELPDWLAAWLQDVNRHLPALGRERRAGLNRQAADARQRVLTMTPGSADEGDYLGAWVRWELDRVDEANREGGWNDAIYQCVLNLMEGGWEEEVVTEAVLKVAKPVNSLETRNAMYTIDSACRRHRQKQAKGEVG